MWEGDINNKMGAYKIMSGFGGRVRKLLIDWAEVFYSGVLASLESSISCFEESFSYCLSPCLNTKSMRFYLPLIWTNVGVQTEGWGSE